MVYVKEEIIVSEVKIINNVNAELKECLWLQLESGGEKIMFGAIYRKGRSNAANSKLLNRTIEKVTTMYDRVLICGDLNYPEINWETFNVNVGPYSAPAGTFTPAVFSTSGGMGKEADRLLRRMAERMSIKRGENYSSVVSFLRRRFRFDLLKTCVIAMRGYKKPTTTAAKIDTLDLDLRTTASSC